MATTAWMMDTTRLAKSALYLRKTPNRIARKSKNQPTVHFVLSCAYFTRVRSAMTFSGGGADLAIVRTGGRGRSARENGEREVGYWFSAFFFARCRRKPENPVSSCEMERREKGDCSNV